MRRKLMVLLSPRHEHRILGLMLVCLHFALWWDFASLASRSLMLTHLGLFLIWQPLWGRHREIETKGAVVSVIAILALVYWLDWRLVAFWILLLTGFIGGHVTERRGERLAYLSALVFLVSELLIAAIPPIVEVAALRPEAAELFRYVVLAVPVGIMLIPAAPRGENDGRSVDFIYGLTISLLIAILALGSLLSNFLTDADYPVAVIQTILGIAFFMLVISWLWAPFAGFSGLGNLWERYLQRIGTPFEQWLTSVARLAQVEQTPEQFLESAADLLLEFTWVAGVTGRTATIELDRGQHTAHAIRIRTDSLDLAVNVHRRPGTALLLHGKLLLRLVGYFFTAKVRERELAQRAHLQAIYETGARLTHDIKNLLQSLHTMSTALQHSPPERKAEVQALMERQLPHITQRLQLALDKLRDPRTEAVTRSALSDWWNDLKARSTGQGIIFDAELDADPKVPSELFESVVENLLENARIKRQSEPDIEIHVYLSANGEGTRLAVWDTGSAVPDAVASDLFNAPVRSSSGLGIGLYQASRQAEQNGYRLALTSGTESNVRFELSSTDEKPERPRAM